MASFSNINHHFLAPSLLKPLKSSPRYQKSLGVLPRDHSDHWGPVSAQIYLQKSTYVDSFCYINLSWVF